MLVRAVLLLLSLCAFCAQQWVERTHWHGAAAAEVSVSAPLGSTGEGPASSCLLCQIASHATSAGPPAHLSELTLAARPYTFRVPERREVEVAATPAHAWQSRGPPA